VGGGVSNYPAPHAVSSHGDAVGVDKLRKSPYLISNSDLK
jgi:hypothetical protein